MSPAVFEVAASVVFLLAMLAAGCALNYVSTPGPFAVSVHVNDAQRQPIAQARVRFDDTALPLTDASGQTSGIVARGEHTLAVSAAGYVDHLWAVDVVANAAYGISLEKAP